MSKSVGVFFFPSFGCDFSFGNNISKFKNLGGLILKSGLLPILLYIAKDRRNGCFRLVDYDDCTNYLH